MLYQHTKFRFFHCFENYKSTIDKVTVTCEKQIIDCYELLPHVIQRLLFPKYHIEMWIVAPSIGHPMNLLTDVLQLKRKLSNKCKILLLLIKTDTQY